jgi:hypothetical protein
LTKPYHVSLEAPAEASAEAGDTLKLKGIGYSLTGITSGIVKKRQLEKAEILAAFLPKIGLNG